MEMNERTVEIIKERFGGEKGLQEFLLLQLLTNPQGVDPSILPLLVLSSGGGGRGRRSEMLALMAVVLASQAQQTAQAAQAATGGVTPPPTAPQSSTNTGLLMALALGLFGEERELVVRSGEVSEFAKKPK
jgi:hypothetical protein